METVFPVKWISQKKKGKEHYFTYSGMGRNA